MVLARAALRTIRPVSGARSIVTRASPIARPSAFAVSRLPSVWQRSYADAAGLPKSEIEKRILDVLRAFEKVDPAKVSTSAKFTEDLALDSLDAVEVVMAIEEEFSIEIPDEDADRIVSVDGAVDYVSKTSEAM